MRTWTLAGAFDAGHIRGGTPGWEQELDFHQLELTGHAAQLEADYRLFREEFGLTQFRDGAWLSRSYPAPEQFDWSYLDRLANMSQGQVTLSLCHYEWLPWITEADLWNGRVIDLMTAFAYRVAERYRGCFAAYIPVVESGYWTAMMTDWGRWWPATREKGGAGWWKLYAVVGRMLVGMARAVKEADPAAQIALSEPWAWHPHVSLRDQARPFFTLLGHPDPTAAQETGIEDWGGEDSLLQVIGLNFYNNWGVEHSWPLSRLLLEARRQFPDKRIVMGETGNCHFSDCYTVAGWLQLIDEQVELANSQGARIEAVTWVPILTLGDFDWGKPAPGAWVTWDADDPQRRRHWDPEVARIVRAYTGSPLMGYT
ncbi:MAG TPA: hypothetical protein VFB38_08125 [Chthonomonadaceae bacterium]|nr:hypothetical protein [Chthonomonadaceae bacterium]